jgi:DNA helicase-2/ATP-dependent DNA helicase PcrA
MEQNNLPLAERRLENIENGVRLMTAHKAKGLEFEVVFMIKLIDGLWGNKSERNLIKLPSEILAIQKKETPEIEEERRLFYVAMTRAKEKLYLTWADQYTDSSTFKLPSQFLQELPKAKLHKIKTEAIEKNVLGVLKNSLLEKKTLLPLDLKHFYESILQDFCLTPTAMNAYLKCPKLFFYDNFLKIPKTKTAPQAYGTAVHKALEQIFKDKISHPQKFKLDLFLKYFNSALKKEILNKTDFLRYQTTGKENLKKYWLNNEKNFKDQAVIGLEYNFSKHRVLYDGIPITGKIDKIVLLDKVAQEVAITDYKTSQPKSLNFLMGKTKVKNTDFLYQAYFYKLLSEEDKFFHWKIKQIFFDFTEPENNKFKNVELNVDKSEFINFKKIVKETYQNISDFKFSEIKDCPYKKDCQYKEFC